MIVVCKQQYESFMVGDICELTLEHKNSNNISVSKLYGDRERKCFKNAYVLRDHFEPLFL